MPVDEHADAGPRELRPQIALAAVDDDEVGPQRQDPLDIGIEQRADARQLVTSGGNVVEAADRDDLRPGADREQHLGDGGDEGDDACRVA